MYWNVSYDLETGLLRRRSWARHTILLQRKTNAWQALHNVKSQKPTQALCLLWWEDKKTNKQNKNNYEKTKQKTKHAPLNICYVATVAQQMLYSTLRHVEYRRRAIYKAQTLLKRNRSTLYWTTNKNIKEFIIAIISHLTSKNIVDSICWVTT